MKETRPTNKFITEIDIFPYNIMYYFLIQIMHVSNYSMSTHLIRQTDPLRQRGPKKAPTVEPNVINEEMLRKGVVEPLRPDGNLTEPVDFPQVNSLALSYQSLY